MLKIFIIILVIIGGYALFTYIRIAYTVKQANLPNITHTQQTLGIAEPMRYIASGDSTAAGIGTTSSEFAYPTTIAQELAKEHEVTYKNIGVSGARTKDFIEEQLPQIIDYNPDIVTISIGANDQTRLVSNETILKNLTFIITKLLNKTTAEIYMANIPNFASGRLLSRIHILLIEHQSKSLNPKIDRLDNLPRVTIVPVHDIRNVELSADNFHPSNKGYRKWSDFFLQHIQ